MLKTPSFNLFHIIFPPILLYDIASDMIKFNSKFKTNLTRKEVNFGKPKLIIIKFTNTKNYIPNSIR